MEKRITFLIIGLLCISSVFAQLPGAFAYQAVIRGSDGLPLLNKQVKVKLSIRATSVSGPIQYSETHLLTTSPQGLIDLEVGKGTVLAGKFADIHWEEGVFYLDVSMDPAGGNAFQQVGASRLVSVPYALYAGKSQSADASFKVRGTSGLSPDSALFEVKDKNGNVVFAVYEDGAVVYVDENAKGGRGGFAVGGRTSKKGVVYDLMLITPDSIRMYIPGDPGIKGGRGGFAVGGRTSQKGQFDNYFNISGSSEAEKIEPSEARVLWYPKREAFLAGRVWVQDPDSVGTNASGLGYESRPMGNWSQAFGYKTAAKGDYSTSIGKNSLATGMNSFAFGDGAKAIGDDSYAFGAFTESRGRGSFSFGYVGRDSLGPTGNPTIASGDYSLAFGLGARAPGFGAMALGNEAKASGAFSMALGFFSVADNWCGMAMGDSTQARAGSATSMGFKTSAMHWAATAMGHETKATGPISLSTGIFTEASGDVSLSLGNSTKAMGNNSLAGGWKSEARGVGSFAFGSTCIADSNESFAIGVLTKAIGYQAFACGSGSSALNFFSFATGSNTKASGFGSASFGNGTISTEAWAVSFGQHTKATGVLSTSFGDSTTASGIISSAFGKNTQATEWVSTAFGQLSRATGAHAFATGYNTLASGGISFSLGANGVASGTKSLVMGGACKAFGESSIATGESTQAHAIASASFGYDTRAKGNSSISAGHGTIAKTFACVSIGIWNDTSGVTTDYFNRWDPADPAFVIGDGESATQRSNAFTVLKNSYVGIDTSRPGQKLDIVRGNGRVQTGYSWLTSSDVRYKKNITELEGALPKIMAIRGVRYDLKEDRQSVPQQGKNIGFIAQELEEQFPEFVVTDASGYKAVAYDKMTAVLVEAVKEQQREIESLRKENERLQKLEERILELEKRMQP